MFHLYTHQHAQTKHTITSSHLEPVHRPEVNSRLAGHSPRSTGRPRSSSRPLRPATAPAPTLAPLLLLLGQQGPEAVAQEGELRVWGEGGGGVKQQEGWCKDGATVWSTKGWGCLFARSTVCACV